MNSKSKETGVSEISILINSIYFFIECVFILHLPGRYRLVAIHNGNVLIDNFYKTTRGARIAFTKLYSDRSWKEGVRPQWSDFYDPDQKWLGEKIQLVE